MIKKITLLSLIITVLMSFSSVYAQTTSVTVRAKAKDAKFIGTSIGGAQIIIKNARTGEILAEGITSGSTGDTEKIMKTPHKRGETMADDKTAGFTANLDLKEPVFVTVEAYAPVLKKQAAVLSSTQLWLIPGKNIEGEGLVLDIPGFVVDILSPQTHESVYPGSELRLKANVVMMCGCPTSPDGIWDANDYEVKALIKSDTGNRTEVELKFADKQSTFTATTILEEGVYHISIYAYDAKTGNTGLDQTSVIIK
ncbi:hypothetical protein [Psychroflexus sp. MES1-P1E]|uniref:hypothetical protein n=1 Tax=Psychroflexus sp. MES1-P1E TaxID=2058320 RepID=UPI001C60A0B9|nr:hypothetical protein [Psychroflexus sp. MES1-P1E]